MNYTGRMVDMKKKWGIGFFIILMLLFLVQGSSVQAAGTEMNLYAMYLGNDDKGDSVLLESKGEYLLMDLGVASHADAIIRQLQAVNAQKIDVYLSHLHLDHAGGGSGDFLAGLKKLANAGIQIETMYLPDRSLAPLSVDYATKYQHLEEFMKGKGNIRYLQVGDTLSVGDVTGKIIGPLNVDRLSPEMYRGLADSGDGESEAGPEYTYYENNCSLAAIFTCGDTRFFTAGDCLEDEAEFLVEKYGSTLKCDIMKLSHHGTGSGNTAALLEAVSPRYSFASNTGQTSVNPQTGKWKTNVAVENASRYGMCYLVGSQKKTLIYQVQNGAIRMYEGETCASGKFLTGWQQIIGADGKFRKTDVYYLDQNGKPLTGVQYIDGHYMYFGEGGCMEYGNYSADGTYQYWKSYGDRRRYFTYSSDRKYAYMTVGFREIGNTLYYFDKDGFKIEGSGKTERIKIGNNYYAVGKSGAITRKNWATIGSSKYYFDSNGVMKKNYKVKIGRNYYIFGSDGRMQRASAGKKIVTVAGKKYCVGISGALVIHNWATVGGSKYYFGKSGIMLTNYKAKIGNNYYYFGSNGKMVRASKGKKLVRSGKYTYCVGISGALVVRNWATVGNDKYYFGKTGNMQKNYRVRIGKSFYYFGRTGKMIRNQSVKIGKKRYYFGKNGAMYRDKNITISGKKYYCSNTGVMRPR